MTENLEQNYIVECKEVERANGLIRTGTYRLLEYDNYKGYILVRRKAKA